MEDIVANVGTLASFIGSLTVVGNVLIWIYNKFIGASREKRREREEEKRHEWTLEVVTKENKPLIESIENLNKWIEESRQDRENLNKMIKENIEVLGKHNERLNNHHGRLIALETKNEIKTFKYIEEYKGESK